METQSSIQLSDLYTISGLVTLANGAIGANQIRWQVRHRNENGLASACVLVGRKLLISRSRYELWLATQAGSGREG